MGVIRGSLISVLGHLKWAVVHPVGLGVSALHVHLIDFWCHQLLEVGWVLLNLRRVLLTTDHIDGPASVILRHQVQTFGMVDTVLLPAVYQFVLERRCFLGGDASLSLEVSSDKFRHNHAFWWDTHFLMADLIL